MRQFADTKGRTWTVAINVAAVKRVRSLLKFDLLDLESSFFKRLAVDPVLFVDLLYVLCNGQAAEAGSPELEQDFGEAMGGDALDAAATAFSEELVDFFPEPRRSLLRRVMEKATAYQAKAVALAEEQLAAGALDAALERALTPSRPSTSSPGPSE